MCDKADRSFPGYREWISVEEKLPDYKNEVLVWMTGRQDAKLMIDLWIPRIAIGCRLRTDDHGEVWYTTWGDGSQEGHAVTHWMPLPDPPEAKK